MSNLALRILVGIGLTMVVLALFLPGPLLLRSLVSFIGGILFGWSGTKLYTRHG